MSLSRIISNPSVQRFGGSVLRTFAPRLQFGTTAVFSTWHDVQEILKRDMDFLIAPINGERIERVNGPFILGMDRKDTHLSERQALYSAIRHSDPDKIQKLVDDQAQQILNTIPAGGKIDIVNEYARIIAARSALAFLGTECPSEEDRMRVARALFHECFLNLGDDETIRSKAVAAGEELKNWLLEEIKKRRQSKKQKDDLIGRMITDGLLDDDAIRRNVSGMLVGAIDTTATCVAQIMDVFLNRPMVMDAVLKDLDNPDLMRGWCWEALRFYAHNPIIQRQAAHDTTIGTTNIKAGTRIICFTLSAMHDKGAFPLPKQFNPKRPEQNYLHFGGGLHPCAGRAINGVQIPALVAALLARDPKIEDNIAFDGPFPDRFVLRLQK